MRLHDLVVVTRERAQRRIAIIREDICLVRNDWKLAQLHLVHGFEVVRGGDLTVHFFDIPETFERRLALRRGEPARTRREHKGLAVELKMELPRRSGQFPVRADGDGDRSVPSVRGEQIVALWT